MNLSRYNDCEFAGVDERIFLYDFFPDSIDANKFSFDSSEDRNIGKLLYDNNEVFSVSLCSRQAPANLKIREHFYKKFKNLFFPNQDVLRLSDGTVMENFFAIAFSKAATLDGIYFLSFYLESTVNVSNNRFNLTNERNNLFLNQTNSQYKAFGVLVYPFLFGLNTDEVYVDSPSNFRNLKNLMNQPNPYKFKPIGKFYPKSGVMLLDFDLLSQNFFPISLNSNPITGFLSNFVSSQRRIWFNSSLSSNFSIFDKQERVVSGTTSSSLSQFDFSLSKGNNHSNLSWTSDFSLGAPVSELTGKHFVKVNLVITNTAIPLNFSPNNFKVKVRKRYRISSNNLVSDYFEVEPQMSFLTIYQNTLLVSFEFEVEFYPFVGNSPSTANFVNRDCASLDVRVEFFNGNSLLSLPSGSNYNLFYKFYKLGQMCSIKSLDMTYLRKYLCQSKTGEQNDSDNPTNKHLEFASSYFTGISLLDSERNVVAVGKFSKPVLKNSNFERLIEINLKLL